MRPKAPIYRTENAEPLKAELDQLQEVCKDLTPHMPGYMMERLMAAIGAVEEASKATVPIKKGGCSVGYGLDATQKAIACDTAIAILRQIKAAKGW